MVKQISRQKGESGRQWLERLRDLSDRIDPKDWDSYQEAFDQALALAEKEEQATG
jgi:hypothetical protein